MTQKLKGKAAIISGAASGIGLATATLFAKHGADLVLTDINAEALEKTKKELTESGTKVATLVADSSKPEDNEKTVELAMKEFGRLDIAVNNAGIGGELKPTGEYSIEAWDKVIAVNLSGVFYGMRYQIPAMLKSGGPAAIVNLASILGSAGSPGIPAYTAAKHGVVGLTKTSALEYSAHGIRVNAVGPGYIDTPLLEALDEEQYGGLVAMHPIGRLGKAEEVANIILFLASEDSSFVTGGYYPIDGGYLAQ